MLGEQTFDALGKRWTLFLGNAAQCAIEERYDRGFFAVVSDAMPNVDAATALAVMDAQSTGAALPRDVAERVAGALGGMRVSVLRDLAWAGLQRHHGEATPALVSDLIDDLGQERFGEIIGAAIRAAQGVGDDAEPGKPETLRRAPTGKRSSSNGAARASKKPASGVPRRSAMPRPSKAG